MAWPMKPRAIPPGVSGSDHSRKPQNYKHLRRNWMQVTRWKAQGFSEG